MHRLILQQADLKLRSHWVPITFSSVKVNLTCFSHLRSRMIRTRAWQGCVKAASSTCVISTGNAAGRMWAGCPRAGLWLLLLLLQQPGLQWALCLGLALLWDLALLVWPPPNPSNWIMLQVLKCPNCTKSFKKMGGKRSKAKKRETDASQLLLCSQLSFEW